MRRRSISPFYSTQSRSLVPCFPHALAIVAYPLLFSGRLFFSFLRRLIVKYAHKYQTPTLVLSGMCFKPELWPVSLSTKAEIFNDPKAFLS